MKIWISIADEVFDEAERLAKRTKRSLSRLFSAAIAEYLARHEPEPITATMDRVCLESGNNDEFVRAAAHRTLDECEW
jgi:antitoxin MazE6